MIALSAYGFPTAMFAMMYANTCSLMFHGPGFSEKLRSIPFQPCLPSSTGQGIGIRDQNVIIGSEYVASFAMGYEASTSTGG